MTNNIPEEEEGIPTYIDYHCVSCFKNWREISDINVIYNSDYETLCDFCEKNTSSLELLKRQVDVMPTAYASDFPKVIKNLMNHVVLKDE